jgi:hypothetical protein
MRIQRFDAVHSFDVRGDGRMILGKEHDCKVIEES